jgi:hypothetical protein
MSQFAHIIETRYGPVRVQITQWSHVHVTSKTLDERDKVPLTCRNIPMNISLHLYRDVLNATAWTSISETGKKYQYFSRVGGGEVPTKTQLEVEGQVMNAVRLWDSTPAARQDFILAEQLHRQTTLDVANGKVAEFEKALNAAKAARNACEADLRAWDREVHTLSKDVEVKRVPRNASPGVE